MTRNTEANRRTILKALPTAVLGGSAAAGTAMAASSGSEGVARAGTEPDSGHWESDYPTVEVLGTHDHDNHEWGLFKLQDDMQTGWTTLTFNNLTGHSHFLYLVKLSEAALEDPDDLYEDPPLLDVAGDTIADKYRTAVNEAFQDAWDPYYAGDVDVQTFVDELIDGLPDWFFTEVTPVGGVGMTGPEEVTSTTQYLEPGTYVMECYVLDDEGRFHSPFGMVESLTVTETASDLDAPSADHEVTISSVDGLSFDGPPVDAGVRHFAVTFEDNAEYANALGHDVHLVRLDGDTTVEDVNEWIDYLDFESDPEADDFLMYRDRGALISTPDAPGPETFLGGVQDLFPAPPEDDQLMVFAIYLDIDGDGDYFEWSDVPGEDRESFDGFGDDAEGLNWVPTGEFTIDDATELTYFPSEEAITFGDLTAGNMEGVDPDTEASIAVGVFDDAESAVEEAILSDISVASDAIDDSAPFLDRIETWEWYPEDPALWSRSEGPFDFSADGRRWMAQPRPMDDEVSTRVHNAGAGNAIVTVPLGPIGEVDEITIHAEPGIRVDEPVTAVSHVDLTSGEYALVAEIPDPMGQGMVETFSVRVVADYADETGVVGTDGVLSAIEDWRSGVISTATVLDVIAAWRSGEPVD